jgi:predicted nucleotidyltransferase
MAIEHLRGTGLANDVRRPTSDGTIDGVCRQVAERLAQIDGIQAIALGGSRARGTAREDSDIDFGLYYEPGSPFAIDELDAAARELDDRHIGGLVTGFGAWGAGVNGGGWLLVSSRQVDLLYRDLRRVRTVIKRCVRGEIDAIYQLGHPLGFQNQIYAGEIHVCRPLCDPKHELAGLKKLVASYPPLMRRALVNKHLFDAQFEIEIADGPAARGDIVYVSQCLARAAGFMLLVLHALNERFFLNEKNAFIESRSFSLRPPDFHRQMEATIGQLGNSAAELMQSVAATRTIVNKLRTFCDEQYPRESATDPINATREQLAAKLGKF